jgi:UDP-glucose 4-epimerase
MKILITGGAGFIGSHIVDAYCDLGHDVVAIDDLSTGHARNVNPAARFIQMDIRDAHLDELFADERFDLVNHQAARGNVRASIEDPLVYADVNVRGGVNLLESSRKHGVRKFVYASTGGCVYGEPKYVPSDEAHPIAPRDPYGASKASFELYLPVFAHLWGLKYTIFRYPNVYGPRQDPLGEAGVVSIFLGQMFRGHQPIINGDGEQERDYVFVTDVARANSLALEGGDNNVFNVGWGVGTSVNTVFQELCDIIGKRVSAQHGPAKEGEVRRSCLDSSRAKSVLGWSPTVQLRDGLALTADFVKSSISIGVDSSNLTDSALRTREVGS